MSTPNRSKFLVSFIIGYNDAAATTNQDRAGGWRIAKWVVIDKTTEGAASGIARDRLLAALQGAGASVERHIAWTDAYTERAV